MIGTKIRELRKRKCINQAEFAKRVGVSQGFISLTENNCRIPSQELMDTISRELGVEASQLMVCKEKRGISQLVSNLSGLNSQQISILNQIVLQFKNETINRKGELNFDTSETPVDNMSHLKVFNEDKISIESDLDNVQSRKDDFSEVPINVFSN